MWRPIDTVPLNTPVFVTDGNVIVSVTISEMDGGKITYPEPVGIEGWDWDWGWEELTHWMPWVPLPTKE